MLFPSSAKEASLVNTRNILMTGAPGFVIDGLAPNLPGKFPEKGLKTGVY
jgi:hypothetical protein